MCSPLLPTIGELTGRLLARLACTSGAYVRTVLNCLVNISILLLGYLHRASNDLTLVAEFEGVPMQGESILSVGYKYDLPKANVSFKGVVDTQWNVSCIVEKRLDPLPASLTLSALINHVSDKSRFGIGFSLG